MRRLLLAGIIITASACAGDGSTGRERANGYEQNDAAVRADTVETGGASDAGDSTPDAVEGDASAWITSPIRVKRPVSEVAVVAAIRAAEHDGYDRFVIELENNELPGYTLQYQEGEPRDCGSGRPVMLAGSAALEVRLEPARGYTEEGSATVDHADRALDLPTIKEIDVTCDFEAVFTVALGVSGKMPFRAAELANPPRLVVDIRHDGG